MVTDVRSEDQFDLHSIGVDIGSATTHFSLARLTAKKFGTRYHVVGREILFESAIVLTPYLADTDIDATGLGEFFDQEFARAGVVQDDIDTGALILTGAAVQRKNARRIADLFAAQSGKLVSVSAGDELEALMAARGSGTLQLSAELGQRIANIDIGGGTTKITVCDGGRVGEIGVFDVGGRLVVTDPAGRVVRLERYGKWAAEAVGLDIGLGRDLPTDGRVHIAEKLIGVLVDDLFGVHDAESPLRRGEPLAGMEKIAAVTLTGGVSEYVHGRVDEDFGDLGRWMAESLHRALGRAGVPIIETSKGIRATVLGASQYSVQISGSTTFVSSLDLLPARNVPVVVPLVPLAGDEVDVSEVARAVRTSVAQRGAAEEEPVALGIRWAGSATFARLSAVAEGVVRGLGTDHGQTVILLCDDDVARLLGRRVEDARRGGGVVSVDGVSVSDFDFVDIGGYLPGAASVSVVVKSLVFPALEASWP